MELANVLDILLKGADGLFYSHGNTCTFYAKLPSGQSFLKTNQ